MKVKLRLRIVEQVGNLSRSERRTRKWGTMEGKWSGIIFFDSVSRSGQDHGVCWLNQCQTKTSVMNDLMFLFVIERRRLVTTCDLRPQQTAQSNRRRKKNHR